MVRWLSLFSSFVSTLAKFRAPQSLYTPATTGPSPLWFEPEMVQHAVFLAGSYEEKSGRRLFGLTEADVQNADLLARKLFFHESGVLLSHGVQCEGDGPILNYANSLGLQLWQASWEELTVMASKYTAETENQEKRAQLLDQVSREGYLSSYSGVRIALDKSRFRISDATIWNMDMQGVRLGQAAIFESFELL